VEGWASDEENQGSSGSISRSICGEEVVWLRTKFCTCIVAELDNRSRKGGGIAAVGGDGGALARWTDYPAFRLFHFSDSLSSSPLKSLPFLASLLPSERHRAKSMHVQPRLIGTIGPLPVPRRMRMRHSRQHTLEPDRDVDGVKQLAYVRKTQSLGWSVTITTTITHLTRPHNLDSTVHICFPSSGTLPRISTRWAPNNRPF